MFSKLDVVGIPPGLLLFILMEWHCLSELRPPEPIVLSPHECGESRWNDTDRENCGTRRETFPSATFSSNSTFIEPGTNPGLRGESPATNRLSHVTWFFSHPACLLFPWIDDKPVVRIVLLMTTEEHAPGRMRIQLPLCGRPLNARPRRLQYFSISLSSLATPEFET
jgi:hypothetical protein